MKLRTFLLAVVGLTLVPLLGIAVLAVVWAHRDERRDAEQALLNHSRSVAAAVDREVESTLAGLRGLAASSDLDAVDRRRFLEQARLAREAHPRWLTVALADASGRQVLDLLHPTGSSLPGLDGLDAFQRTVRTGEPQVSDLVVDAATGRAAIAITLPLHREGKVGRVLVATMPPAGFGTALAAAHLGSATTGTIVDRRGVVIATTRGAEEPVGQPATDAPGAATVSSPAARSGFSARISMPSAQLDAPLRRSLWLLAGAAGGALALSLVFANLGGRRFAGRLRRLTEALRAFGRGETVPDLPVFTLAELTGVTGSLRDAMELLQTRTAALQESERRYRTMFQRNPAGMCLSLRDGRIVGCNEAFARILGFELPADALTVNAAELYVRPEDRERVLERLEAQQTVVNVELELRRRDGRQIWALASVLRASGPHHADYETTLIDVTEQKAAAELRSIARLASAAAHEINNPLAVVMARLSMVQADDPTLTPETRERLTKAYAAAQRIREIVADMHRLTSVRIFEHTGRGLPEMIDIRKSAAGGDAGSQATPVG